MRSPPAPRAGSTAGRARPPQRGGRYGLLLLVLISTYLLSAFDLKVAADLQVLLFLTVLLLTLRSSRLPRRWAMLAGAVALIGSAAAFGASLTGTQVGDGVAAIWKGLVLLLTAVLIVRRVLARPTILAPGSGRSASPVRARSQWGGESGRADGPGCVMSGDQQVDAFPG